jgi:hypothetical protein
VVVGDGLGNGYVLLVSVAMTPIIFPHISDFDFVVKESLIVNAVFNEVMGGGKASYLEVLTAQESLLNAQLNEAMNMYNGAQGIIALYIALGGGTR